VAPPKGPAGQLTTVVGLDTTCECTTGTVATEATTGAASTTLRLRRASTGLPETSPSSARHTSAPTILFIIIIVAVVGLGSSLLAVVL
jgi:hypothetical protein